MLRSCQNRLRERAAIATKDALTQLCVFLCKLCVERPTTNLFNLDFSQSLLRINTEIAESAQINLN